MPESRPVQVRAHAGRLPLAARLPGIWDAGVVLLSPAEEVDFASERARALLGCRTDRDVTRRWTEIREQVAPHLPAAKANDQPVEFTLQLRGTGRRRGALVLGQVFEIAEEECTGYLLVLQSAEVAASVEAGLRHASRSRGLASLSRDTAHDLKGMLNVIKLNAELLHRLARPEADEAGGASPADRRADVIRRELQRLERAIDVLLDRAALESPDAAVFDVTGVCRNLMDLVAARCRRQRVEQRFEAPPAPASVEGFADRVHAALLSLLVNALDAMPRGGTLAMRVTAGDEVRISVADTGPGVDPSQVDDIWRLRHSTRPGAAGIGLHVVRSVAGAHGGRAEYAPAEGGGACFTLILPAAGAGRA